jgi:hypothetical protein
MKRLVPLLILAVFCLGSLGGRVLHIHHYFQKRASTHRGCSISLAAYESPGSLDEEAEQPLAPSGHLIFFPEPYGQDLLIWEWARPTIQSQDHRQGLGCGGLPA